MVRRVKITAVFFFGAVLVFGAVTQVKAVNIITNGSFETGDFTGWGTKDMAVPFYSLAVRGAGTSPRSFFQSAPTDGSFAATHGFDGGGPDTIEIFQDVTIPAGHSAILTLDWRAGWDFTFGSPATVRHLDLVVEPAGGGGPLLTTNILTADSAVNMVLLDTGPQSDLVDLSAFAGSSIRINFLSTIPDRFSGPAHLQIDNVVLDVQPILLSDIAAIHIEDARAEKREALKRIDAALEKEWVAYEALEELLESGDYGDLDKGDIVKAKQDIHSATQREERSIDTLVKSIENLEDALAALGVEPEPEPNLVGQWKFDEGSGTIAYDSAGNNDGTVYGATWTTGQIDDALSFDGVNDYVDVSDDSSLRFSQSDSFSTSFWAMPLGGNHIHHVVGKMRASAQRGFFGYETLWYSTKSAFAFSIEKSYVGWVDVFTLDNSAPAGSWYHVTAVYDNKDMKIYLNGELHDSGTFSYDTGNTTPDKNLAIGVRSYDSTLEKYFNGTIDDVRIYDRALSAEEIWLLYQNGLGKPGKGKK